MHLPSITIGLMEKQVLVRKGLLLLIDQFENCKVIFEAGNGQELIQKLAAETKPTLLILELEIPVKQSLKTLAWLQKNHSEIPVVILSNIDPGLSLIDILNTGIRAFLKKERSPDELKKAIFEILENGYYTDTTYRKLMKLLFDSQNNKKYQFKLKLSEKELVFLELSSSDRTYKQIATEMKMSPKGVDKIRARLFQNFDVKSRVGLTISAVQNGIVALEKGTIQAAYTQFFCLLCLIQKICFADLPGACN